MAQEDLLEGTLAIIKPDAVHRYREILKRIEGEGFLVVEIKCFSMSRAMAHKLYKDKEDLDGYPWRVDDLLDYITSGKIVAMCLACKDGVRKWKEFMGPTRVSRSISGQSLKMKVPPKHDGV